VLFVAGDLACALPQGAVRALLPLPRLDAPPGLPPPLAGFLNLGGQAVPVVDLARLLGAAPGESHPYRHLVLLGGAVRGVEGGLALLVDRVVDVLPGGAPLRPVEAGRSLNGMIAGAVEVEGVTAYLLDPGRLLLAEEEAVLGSLAGQARARLARWGIAGRAAGEPPGPTA